MSEKKVSDKKNVAESFGEMIKAFGDAVSEIFKDPELKEKARDFGRSATESAQAFGRRLKDEDIKGKFRQVGKAAQDFSKDIKDTFKKGKGKRKEQNCQ